jgi:bla regulator protein blaR1
MIAWALDTLIGVTVLMLLVLALRVPVARAFGAEWAYALWLLPLIRLVVPPFDLFAAQTTSALPAYTVIVIPAAAQASETASASEGIGLLSFLLGLWLTGAALFVYLQKRNYRAFIEEIGEGRRSRPAEHGGIPVVESGGVDGPLAIGMFRPRIIVPLDFSTRYTPAERRLALDHELIHHRRGDLWWNVVALGLLAFNWFNPLAWIAFRAFRSDQELACDAAVARRRSHAERFDYACAIVKSATAHRQVAACPLNGAEQLKERLRMLGEHRVSGSRTAGGIAALAGLAISGVVISGAGFAKQGQARAAATAADMILVQSEGDNRIVAAQDVATFAAIVPGLPAGPVAEQDRTGSAAAVQSVEQPRNVSQGAGPGREPMIESVIFAQTRGSSPPLIFVPSDGSPPEGVRTVVIHATAQAGTDRRPGHSELEQLIGAKADPTGRAVQDHLAGIRELRAQAGEISTGTTVRVFWMQRTADDDNK